MAATTTDQIGSPNPAAITVSNDKEESIHRDVPDWNQRNKLDANGADSDSNDSLYSATPSTVGESPPSDGSEDSLFAMAASIISDGVSGGASSTMVFKRGDRKARGLIFVLLGGGSPYSLVSLKIVQRFGHYEHMRTDNLPTLKGYAGEEKSPLGYVWLDFRINDSKKLFRTKFFVVEDCDISLSRGRRDFDASLGVKACDRVTELHTIDAGPHQGARHPN